LNLAKQTMSSTSMGMPAVRRRFAVHNRPTRISILSQHASFALLLLATVFRIGAFAQQAEMQQLAPVSGAAEATDAEVAAALANSKHGDAMQQMLNWAIQNSDPEKVQELVKKYQEQNLTIMDVYGKEVLDAMFVDEGSVLKETIAEVADFGNSSVSDDDLESALTRLQDLVEQIDNAGNLHRNGGLKPLLDLGVQEEAAAAVPRSAGVRSLALWTLGVAVQNNAPVQIELMEIDGLRRLLDCLPRCGKSPSPGSEGVEWCGKLLFAISSLVKNSNEVQVAADRLGLMDWLVDVGMQYSSTNMVKKALSLLDIILAQSPALPFLDRVTARQDDMGNVLISQVQQGADGKSDTDLAEKALRLVNRLLSLRPLLFRPSFRSELSAAVHQAHASCEKEYGVGDELCTGLQGLAQHAELALAARDLTDDEL